MKLYWLWKNRYLLLNVGLAMAIILGFYELTTRKLDVLKDWSVSLTEVEERNNGMPVYNPGDTLLFTSKSEKLVDADGVTTRMIVCEPHEGFKKLEIQLDTLPASRPAGINEPRNNAIFVPDVARFNGLPRTCRLVFDICYDDVVLWRDHCEHTETEEFIVEEEQLDAKGLQNSIEELKSRIRDLEAQLVIAQQKDSSKPQATQQNDVASTPQSSQPTSSGKSSNQQQEQTPQPKPCLVNLIGLCIVR